jgi:hypothetical protein
MFSQRINADKTSTVRVRHARGKRLKAARACIRERLNSPSCFLSLFLFEVVPPLRLRLVLLSLRIREARKESSPPRSYCYCYLADVYLWIRFDVCVPRRAVPIAKSTKRLPLYSFGKLRSRTGTPERARSAFTIGRSADRQIGVI